MIRWRLQNGEWHSADGTWRVYLDVQQADGRPQWHAMRCGQPLLRKNGQIGYWAQAAGARAAAERYAANELGPLRARHPNDTGDLR